MYSLFLLLGDDIMREQTMNDRDTPILVSYDNGSKQFIMYRNTRKKRKTNGVKFYIIIAMKLLKIFLWN
jgi:outer membrane phospholipase A